MDFEACSRTFGYRFADERLLRRALTHRSHGADHNERLEFLGDSVLNCAVALELYRKFPDLPEGDLSRLRASIVSQPALASVARGIGLGAQLSLGEGELKSGGGDRPSILADALEAVVGAAFLDGGPEAAFAIVRRLFRELLAAADPATTGKDPKTLLQEYLQGRRIPLPQYAVVATQGGAHEQVFRVECVIPSLDIRCLGEGTSRRAAEQQAAREAYEKAVRA